MVKRRIIVFFDGTWNTPDNAGQVTNVVKLLRAIPSMDGDISQITFYDKGVGTGGFSDRIIGGVSGKGLDENVIDGYRFLSNNYVHGDEIYIFGFSRGAYTARSLAGFIGLIGLIQPMHLGRKLIEVITIMRQNIKKEYKQAAIGRIDLQSIKKVPIECVGVWDTVGALGIPGDLGRHLYWKPYSFSDVEVGSNIKVSLHAVAIDEKRSAFAPTLWASQNGAPPLDNQIVEQVWMPGVHSNIGGSYPDSRLSDISLSWMVARVTKHTNLILDEKCLPNPDSFESNIAGTGYESRSTLYLTSRLYPYQRLINQTLPDGRGIGE
ncbi:DUF2235 domain-containing protein (plasmid) [Microbulbifer sp. TRSA002]|uniref:DUF2235 domain-containing protein n=1 Tax=Microbulbifer sp. TRSA002 TaxID=3243382 RepID=UPI004039C83D